MTSRLRPWSSSTYAVLVVLSACVTSTTKGYDGSMMNSLNSLPSYTEYFALNTATTALNTCAAWLGGIVSSAVAGWIANRYGRRTTLIWASVFTICAAILQAASQNIAMFVVSRALIGFGATLSMVAAAAYAAETLPVRRRGWGVGLLGDLYYVGAFISAGITYGTARGLPASSTWIWRIPSALQGFFSIVAVVVLVFVPESPRWLAMNDRADEALAVVALMHADGDVDHPETRAAWREIQDAIEFEKTDAARQATLRQIFGQKDLRMRLILVVSASVCAMLSGNNIVSFYLSDMLDRAGITNSNTQLEIVRPSPLPLLCICMP